MTEVAIVVCGSKFGVSDGESGGGRLVAICTVGNDQPVTPCGRCRQLLWEHGGANLLLEVNGEPRRMSEMLPVAFPEESVFVNPEDGSSS
ncbi:MAG: hypothetical protein ACKOQX_07845 [Actinomycetota bacterium]